MRHPSVSLVGVSLILVAMIAIHPLRASADPLLNRAIESATTSEDHAAIADRFRRMADEQGERAKQHKALAEAYRARGVGSPIKAPEEHCKALASLAEQMKSEYEALAMEHENQSQK